MMALLQNQKRTMAIAGVGMTLFLIAHVLANLVLFSDKQAQAFFDWYQQGFIRWPVLLMFGCLLLIHVSIALQIRRKNMTVRNMAYAKHDSFHPPAWLVTFSIILLFVFIVFHVMQTLSVNPQQSVQQQVMAWFGSPWLLLIYLAGLIILTVHLMHALRNVLQTLAITARQYTVYVAIGVALLFIGFASVPVVFFWIQL